MITYKLHLIRHGQTEGNKNGLFIGRTDMPVSEEGFDELSRLRDTYEYPRVGAVYTSPLRRCLQTAEFLYPNNMLTVVDDLQEMDFGAFEGKSVAELEDDEDFGRWLADSAHNAPPGGETGLQMAERLMRALSEIFAHMMQNRITSAAVITHGGAIMTLLTAFGYPRRELGSWSVENGKGYTILMSPQMWMRDNSFEIYDTGAGYDVTGETEGADVAVLNTCGFIESAKSEAINSILELAELKKAGRLKKLLVAGCLTQRYREEIRTELPEVDGMLGTGSYTDVASAVAELMEGERPEHFGDIHRTYEDGERMVTTPPYTAFLKIAEIGRASCRERV